MKNYNLDNLQHRYAFGGAWIPRCADFDVPRTGPQHQYRYTYSPGKILTEPKLKSTVPPGPVSQQTVPLKPTYRIVCRNPQQHSGEWGDMAARMHGEEERPGLFHDKRDGFNWLKRHGRIDNPSFGWSYDVVQVRPKKEVFYVAHPVSGAPIDNCFRTIRWIKALTELDPTRIYVAPWIGEVMAYPGKAGETHHRSWDVALTDDEEVLSRFDGIVMVGGRISDGMQREWDCARRLGKTCVDMSRFVLPENLPEGFELEPAE